MSYILEALRRAERERHLGQAPTVQALAQAGAAPLAQSRRSPLRLALAAITLALAATAAVLLWRKPAPTVIAEPAPVATAASPAATTPATVAPVAETVPAAAPVAPQVTTAPAAAVVTPPSVPAIVPGRPLQAAVEAAAAAEVIEAEEELATLDDLTAPFEGDPAVSEEPAIESEAEDAAAAQSATVPRAKPAASATAEPALLRDMPSSYRARFPPVRLDVHVYNDDPARRWIMVEGRRYRENEALTSGPRVLAIRVEGVVFEHAGERVLLPLTR